MRIELMTFSIPTKYSTYWTKKEWLWRWWDSNPRPFPCKGNAQPVELHPQFIIFISFHFFFKIIQLNFSYIFSPIIIVLVILSVIVPFPFPFKVFFYAPNILLIFKVSAADRNRTYTVQKTRDLQSPGLTTCPTTAFYLIIILLLL